MNDIIMLYSIGGRLRFEFIGTRRSDIKCESPKNK